MSLSLSAAALISSGIGASYLLIVGRQLHHSAVKCATNLLIVNLLLCLLHLWSATDTDRRRTVDLLTTVGVCLSALPLVASAVVELHHRRVSEQWVRPNVVWLCFIYDLLQLLLAFVAAQLTYDHPPYLASLVAMSAMALAATSAVGYGVARCRRLSDVLRLLPLVVLAGIRFGAAAVVCLTSERWPFVVVAIYEPAALMLVLWSVPATQICRSAAPYQRTTSVLPFKSDAEATPADTAATRAKKLQQSVRKGRQLSPGDGRVAAKPISPVMMMLVKPLQVTVRTLERHPGLRHSTTENDAEGTQPIGSVS